FSLVKSSTASFPSLLLWRGVYSIRARAAVLERSGAARPLRDRALRRLPLDGGRLPPARGQDGAALPRRAALGRGGEQHRPRRLRRLGRLPSLPRVLFQELGLVADAQHDPPVGR